MSHPTLTKGPESFSAFEDYFAEHDENAVLIGPRGLPDMSETIWEAVSPATDFYMHADRLGMRLNHDLVVALSDEPVRLKHGLSVLSRASLLVGRGVNGECCPPELFAPRGYDASMADDWLPAQGQLNRLAESTHHPQYQLLARMLQDTVFPVREAKGYMPIKARPPERARRVFNSHKQKYEETALCDYAEQDFTKLLTSRKNRKKSLIPIKQDGELIGLRKLEGDQTMLLARPVLLNGVRVEPGAIMTVESKSKNQSFSFGRLSIFGCASFCDVVRYFARNIKESMVDSVESRRRTLKALRIFRSEVGLAYVPEFAPQDEATDAVDPEKALQLSIQKNIFDMAVGLVGLRALTHSQEAERAQILLNIHNLRQRAIRRYGWEAFEEVHMNFLGRIASGQSSTISYRESS